MSERLREALESHGCVSAPHDEDDFVDECGVCVIDAAARRFLALTETGPDYERAIDRAIDKLPWEHEIDNFVHGEYDDWLRSIVDAALADYLTEEE